MEKKETYWLEDTLYKTKRYFTVENGKVAGTETSEEDLLKFLTASGKLGYRFGKL